MCLEGSFQREPGSIHSGYLFYGKQQRRTAVAFDTTLRKLTLEIVENFTVDSKQISKLRFFFWKPLILGKGHLTYK